MRYLVQPKLQCGQSRRIYAASQEVIPSSANERRCALLISQRFAAADHVVVKRVSTFLANVSWFGLATNPGGGDSWRKYEGE